MSYTDIGNATILGVERRICAVFANLPLVSICVILNILYILCSINSSGLSYVYLLECLSSEPISLFYSLFCNTKPPSPCLWPSCVFSILFCHSGVWDSRRCWEAYGLLITKQGRMRPQLTRADICNTLLVWVFRGGLVSSSKYLSRTCTNCFVEKAEAAASDIFKVHSCKEMPLSLHALRYFSTLPVLWGSCNQLYSRTCMECACCLQPFNNHCSFRGESYRQPLPINSKGSKVN